jgi:uncharacterized protein
MGQFVLHVPEIEAAGKQYRFAVPASWVASVLEGSDLRADLGAEDGSLDVRADRTGKDGIFVTGKLRSRVVAECVRCLEDAGVEVDADLAVLYSFRAAGAPSVEEPVDVEPGEPDREHYAGEKIELDPIVREHLILEVPMQPLCAADCSGIPIPDHVRPPADFGKEESDPRLEPLKQIAAKLKK